MAVLSGLASALEDWDEDWREGGTAEAVTGGFSVALLGTGWWLCGSRV